MQDVPIQHAATVVLVAQTDQGPKVLMGRRNPNSVFLPNKFVFPGGRMEQKDDRVHPAIAFDPATEKALAFESDQRPNSLGVAALRELYEETGLECQYGYDLGALQFIFRALTPKGPPRRFDTRFFMLDAAALKQAPHELRPKDNELLDLGWFTFEEALALDTIIITQFVISLLQNPVSENYVPWQVASLDFSNLKYIPRNP